MKNPILITFLALVGMFILILCQFFVPLVREFFRGSVLFLVPFIIFSLLGGILVFLTLKRKVEGGLKTFLLLTGISSGGFFVSVFLHNVVYALFILLFGEGFWEKSSWGDEPFFFLLAIVVCPIVFFIGVIGSAILFVRRKNSP